MILVESCGVLPNSVQSTEMRILAANLRLILIPEPRPYWPGEVGILGFVDSALESSQRSPETRPPGGSRGFLFFEPRVSIERHRGESDQRRRSVKHELPGRTEERAES